MTSQEDWKFLEGRIVFSDLYVSDPQSSVRSRHLVCFFGKIWTIFFRRAVSQQNLNSRAFGKANNSTVGASFPKCELPPKPGYPI